MKNPDSCFRGYYLLPKYWLDWLVIAFAFLLAMMPNVFRQALAKKITPLIIKLTPKRRYIAMVNLGLCFPDYSQSKLENIFYQHVEIATYLILSYGQLLVRSPQYTSKQFDVVGADYLNKALASDKNVILAFPHVLAVDFASQYISQEHLVTGIMKQHKSDLINWMIIRIRERYLGRIFRRSAGMRPILKGMREGRSLIYLPDEDLGPERSIFSDFFGQKKATVPVLGKLAKASNSVVIFCSVAYSLEKKRFSIEYTEPLENFPSLDVHADTLTMNKEFERIVLQAPEQFMWTMRMFKTRPEGEARIYKSKEK